MNRLTCPIENPAFLLPHSGHMVLIDRVTEHRADFVRVEAHIGEKHILLQNGVLPTTMGMEINWRRRLARLQAYRHWARAKK